MTDTPHATSTAVESPTGLSWWQRLCARFFHSSGPRPKLATGLVNGRYPAAEVFAVRDYYTGRFYCLRPPEDFRMGCGPVMMTMATKRIARAELFNTRADAQAFVDEHMRRARENDPGYPRDPFYGEIVRLAEVEEVRE